jgi:hypothetical protein
MRSTMHSNKLACVHVVVLDCPAGLESVSFRAYITRLKFSHTVFDGFVSCQPAILWNLQG